MKYFRIFAAVLAAALLLSACDAKQQTLRDHSEARAQISQLDQERLTLEQKVDDLRASLNPDPVCVLCFEGAYSSVYDTAYPMLSAAGVPAVVILGSNTLPGLEGMMSSDQAKELLNAGWEFIPAGSAVADSVKDGAPNPAWIADLDHMLAAMKLSGLPEPSGCAFAPDSYNPLIDQTLSDRGITTALHRWSGGKIQEEKLESYGMTPYGGEITGENPVYRIGGTAIFAASSAHLTDIQSACEEYAVIAVTTRQLLYSVPAADQRLDCSSGKYQTLLSELAARGEAEGLRVLTFTGACEYKRGFESDLDKRRADFDAFLKKAQARHAEIEEEIASLMRQMLQD